MSWEPGREVIERLVRSGEFDQVSPDPQVVARLLADAERHLITAASAETSGDLAGAYQLAYDALRKSAAAVLAEQGLRSTVRGGHVAVQDAVVAQFPSIRAFRAFGRIRRGRNRFEYPDTETGGPTVEDVNDAITSALAVRTAAVALIEQGVLGRW